MPTRSQRPVGISAVFDPEEDDFAFVFVDAVEDAVGASLG